MSHAYLYPGLELAPLAYERLVKAIPPARWDERLVEGRFTVREAIAHVADWEPIMRGRMIVAVENSGGTVEAFDEGERAVERGYASTDPLEQVRKFKEERDQTIQFLKVNGHDNWETYVRHPERGRMSLYDQANLLLGHDIYHLEHLSEYL